MRIELDKVGKNGAPFAEVYQPDELAELDEGLRLTQPVRVSGRINREGHNVQVTGSITAKAEVDCDRCLQPIDLPLDAEFEVGYVPVTDYASVETPELASDDLSLSVLEEEAIDIDELAREQILLALPSHALCREDCKGLCPICGINRNMQACQCESTEVDPRWAALKDLGF